MKKILFLILLLAFYGCAFCQKLTFMKDSIFLNDKACLLYNRTGNDFIIYKLDSSKMILGSIQNVGPGKFSTTYTFEPSNKDFTNSKINGRNELLFILIQNKVLTETGELNEKKLLKFIEK
jgi:hypothetical protein